MSDVIITLHGTHITPVSAGLDVGRLRTCNSSSHKLRADPCEGREVDDDILLAASQWWGSSPSLPPTTSQFND